MNLKKLETNFEMESFYLILVFFLAVAAKVTTGI